MITRDDTILMPKGEKRCSSDSCTKASACARRRAAIPAGTPLVDFKSPNYNGGTADCAFFLGVEEARAKAKQEIAQTSTRPVHQPLGGV